MIKKVSELSGAELDAWVLMALHSSQHKRSDGWAENYVKRFQYHPSSDWDAGGVIIERGKIELKTHHKEGWGARCDSHRGGATRAVYGYGKTPLIAAMRAYVASVYGEYVNV